MRWHVVHVLMALGIPPIGYLYTPLSPSVTPFTIHLLYGNCRLSPMRSSILWE